MEKSAQRFSSLKEFYPYYLTEHANFTCRRLHFLGTSLVFVFIGVSIWQQNANWLFAGLISAYSCAWVGHFFFEHNRPATFKYPFYSLISDFIMFGQMLTGKVKIK